jgi:nucleoside-diphosphate-sugar epimerase
MSTIKNIAIAGATGSLGSVVANKVIASGHFNVTLLKRAGSTGTVPEGVKIVEVDYESQSSLQAALEGQDAVVSVLATLAADAQITLIDAAIAAGVKRFLPSEFGCKLDNPNTRKIPIFAAKVKVEDYLKAKSKETSLTYTFIYTSALLDWGITHNFIVDLTTSTPQVLDGGELEFSATSLDTVGQGVVGVLLHPDETKNRAVHIHDQIITQNKVLALARKAFPEKEWVPKSASLKEEYNKAEADLFKGKVDFPIFATLIFRGLMDPEYGGLFKENDNELLGLKVKGDEFIIDTIRAHLA